MFWTSDSYYRPFSSRELATGFLSTEIPIILGCVITHEVGHLLLGSNSHSGSEIMQGQWERGQI